MAILIDNVKDSFSFKTCHLSIQNSISRQDCYSRLLRLELVLIEIDISKTEHYTNREPNLLQNASKIRPAKFK
jgi:hypothetical protein